MNILRRFVSFGAIVAGLFVASAFAGSQTFNTNQWNGAGGWVNDNFSYTTPATTDVSFNLTLTNYDTVPGSTAGGSSIVNCNGVFVYSQGIGVYGTGSKTVTGSSNGNSAGDYTIQHQFGGRPGNYVYGSFHTTLSW